MKIAGKWVGFGLGDKDPKVVWFKDKLRSRFKYAKDLDHSDVFDQALFDVVFTAQGKWGLTQTGIIDYDFQEKAGWVKKLPVDRITGPRGTLYTCQGTQPSDMWGWPQGDVARQVEDLMYFQPIWGEYKATPMNKYINQAKGVMREQINRRPIGDPINAIGFSQGGIIVSEVYTDMKNEGDPRFSDWKKCWTFANPSREQGVENGNKFARLPILGKNKRGIMQESRRMKDTPDWWMDQGNPKDLYFDCETDDEGEFKEAICMMIMGNFTGGQNSILRQIYELSQRPLVETFFMFKAIMDAGAFFGGGIKPHLTHDISHAVRYFRS
jgi:hypothetical protein